MPRPWPTFGDHQQPSALQQVPGEVALDADSLGLGGGEQAQVSPRQKPLHLSPTRPWPSQTLAATSRTGFPREAGRTLKLLYLPRHGWLVQALPLHQRQPQRLPPVSAQTSSHKQAPPHLARGSGGTGQPACGCGECGLGEPGGAGSAGIANQRRQPAGGLAGLGPHRGCGECGLGGPGGPDSANQRRQPAGGRCTRGG